LTKASEEEAMPSFGAAFSKTVIYSVALCASLISANFFFGWSSVDEIPSYLQQYSGILLTVHPYLKYVQAGLIFIFGYLIINSASGTVYTYVRRITEHSTAATLRTITRIAGIAVLLALMTSVFDVNPAAALTVGSFGGLVVGFATQTVLTHAVAGTFLLFSRPFTYGDVITVSGQTGKVKEIKMMHIVLETEDGAKAILIPSGTIVNQIIQKKLPKAILKPVKTMIILDEPAARVKAGVSLTFTGKLVHQGGAPLAGKPVKIFDADIGRDDLLASGVTQEDGSFAVAWCAVKTDALDNTVEVIAKFDGDKDASSSASKQYVVVVETK
jgi:small conductance mechanosensitive channel